MLSREGFEGRPSVYLQNAKVYLVATQGRKRLARDLFLGFLISVLAFCALLPFSLTSVESVTMLVAFNLLFILFVFPLRGKLVKKVLMLVAGNSIGFAWNSALLIGASYLSTTLGRAFEVFYLIVSPILNLAWIVSYWSLTLTFLSESSVQKGRG